MNRREALCAGLAALLSATPSLGRAAPRGFFAAHDLPIGLQLYTVRSDLQRDLTGTLNRVAAMGYGTVEIASLGALTAAAMRTALDEARLVCPSVHVEPTGNGLTLDKEPGRVAELAHTLGARDVVMPIFIYPAGYAPPMGPDPMAMVRAAGAALRVEDYRRCAEFLNVRAAALDRYGLRLGYHNHNVELAPLGNTTGLEILLRETDPRLVSFEMDVGWVAAAGRNPSALLRTHTGRFRQMHVKDLRASTRPNFDLRIDPAEVGAGTTDWAAILPIAYAAGIRQFYVEQEPPFSAPPLNAAARSYRYLTTIGTAKA